MSGENRIAFVLYQIAFAVEKEEIPFLVHSHKIAGPHPFAAVDLNKGLGIRLGALPVTLHNVRPVQNQFTFLSDGNEVIVCDADDGGAHAGDRDSE